MAGTLAVITGVFSIDSALAKILTDMDYQK
jgi:hypothetical protein